MINNIFLLLFGIKLILSENQVPECSAFSSELFANIINSDNNYNQQNIIISPFSVCSALAMTLMGASGNTETEIASGLHIPCSEKQNIAIKFQKLFDSSINSSMLNMANEIVIKNNYPIKSVFNNIIRDKFHSEIKILNFNNKKESVKMINDWVDSKTNHKINNIISDDDINRYTRMLLINALYFKGRWAEPFLPHTTKLKFWNSNTEKVIVDMMINTMSYFKYGEFYNLDATAIEMPYKDSKYSMMIILPKKRDGLKKLEMKLLTTNIFELSNEMLLTRIPVEIPKFKVDFGISMNNVLKTMGMHEMFSDKANFSDLVTNNISNLKISNFLHKVTITVDENGSEAAAVTATIMPMATSGIIYKKTFIANHPFVFIIKNKNTIDFIGHIAKF